MRQRSEHRGSAGREVTGSRLRGAHVITLGHREIQPIETAAALLFQQPAANRIGHQAFLRQIVHLIDLRNLRLVGGRHILVDQARLKRVQEGSTVSHTEPAAELGGGIDTRPKGLPMLTIARIDASRVIGLPDLGLRRQSDDVPEVDDIGRQTGQQVHPVHLETFIAIEVHIIGVQPEQDGRTEERRVRKAIAHFRQTLKGIVTTRLKRLQVLAEKIEIPMGQPLRGQEVIFAAGERPLGTGVTELRHIVWIGHQTHLRPQQQIRVELLGMGPADKCASLRRLAPDLAHTRNLRQLGLLQGTDQPLPLRFRVQHIAILQIAPITKVAVIGWRDRQILARINGPVKAFLQMHAKPVVVRDIRNEEPSPPAREGVGQGGNGKHRHIVHIEPSIAKGHVIAGDQVQILEPKPPSRSLAILGIAIREPALLHPIMIL